MAAGVRVVQRLDADTVSSQKQSPLPRVVQRQAEHPVEIIDTAGPMVFPQVHDDLPVRRRAETVALRQQSLT